MADLLPNMELFPMSSRVNDKEHLEVGGCDVVDLVESYGTPLYIYDEFTLRNMCSQFKNSFTSRYKNTEVLYASKALLLITLKDNPGGNIKPFCDPPTVTSTLHF